MNKKDQTIYALSTPTGKSAVAIIRISGPQSYKLVSKISTNMPIKEKVSNFNKIITKQGLTIDETITTFYKAPRSFTGEDVVEISSHGSSAVIKKIIEVFSKNKNTRIAEPGEFTRRAFENNKLDLTQVEAIADIVNAETEMQRKQAISHLSGDFFNTSREIFENLKKILANIEALIDFTEEDLPKDLMKKIKEQIQNNILKIKKMIKFSSFGISIRDGFTVSIIGKPNTGKSSFINHVSGRDVAIVTNLAGTTRDLIESFVDVDGYPIKFVDTAGIRETKNVIEKVGVEKALLVSREANINIVFLNEKKDMIYFKDIKNPIFVKSKQDISGNQLNGDGFYNISSKTNFGIKEILIAVKKQIENETLGEKSYISRERHLICLREALENLEDSKKTKNVDIFAEDIRVALKNISKLFGGIDIEEILDIVFSDFCIGK